jgi:hypothetical protein
LFLIAEKTLENCLSSSSGKGEPRCATALMPTLNSTPAMTPTDTRPKLRILRVLMHIPELNVDQTKTKLQKA